MTQEVSSKAGIGTAIWVPGSVLDAAELIWHVNLTVSVAVFAVCPGLGNQIK